MVNLHIEPAEPPEGSTGRFDPSHPRGESVERFEERYPRRHAHRLGRADPRWTTASCCAPTCSARWPRASIPALVSYGPYGKGLAFQDGYKTAWEIMARENPDAVAGTTQPVPELGSRRSRRSGCRTATPACASTRAAPGARPAISATTTRARTRDFHDCIEWAAAQPWCSGKVGLNGISYYASSQWRAAALQPPHLAAICVWEGWVDDYRDSARHGGIVCTFRKNWQDMQVKTVQHGVGERGREEPRHRRARVRARDAPRGASSPRTATTCGPSVLSRIRSTDRTTASAAATCRRSTVPLLSAANWGGQGLHPRGNFEGFMRAASKQKWLEVHGGSHWAPFYTDYGVRLQKRFFDYFLKGERERLGQAAARAAAGAPSRREIRASATRTSGRSHARNGRGSISTRRACASRASGAASSKTASTYDAHGRRRHVLDAAARKGDRDHRPVGAEAVRFLVHRRCRLLRRAARVRPAGQGSACSRARSTRTRRSARAGCAPRTASSIRKLVAAVPALSHARREAAARAGRCRSSSTSRSGRPASWCRRATASRSSIRGKDYEYEGEAATLSNMKNPMRGCGPFVHDDPTDRPPAVFGGKVTLHFERQPYLLLPIIPER